jgi:hypothetical protein
MQLILFNSFVDPAILTRVLELSQHFDALCWLSVLDDPLGIRKYLQYS